MVRCIHMLSRLVWSIQQLRLEVDIKNSKKVKVCKENTRGVVFGFCDDGSLRFGFTSIIKQPLHWYPLLLWIEDLDCDVDDHSGMFCERFQTTV